MLGKDAGLGIHMFDRIQNVLQNAWYLSKLSLPQQQAKTAFETAQLVEEFIRGAVPLFEPAETEYNLPLLDLTATLLIKVGAFGDPREFPEPLRGRELTFSFSNPLQDAAEKARVLQFQTVTQLFMLGGQIEPAIKGDIDIRQAFRDAVHGAGAPANWLISEEEAEAAAQAIAEQQQLAQASQMMGGLGEAGQSVGKAVQSFGDAGQSVNAAGAEEGAPTNGSGKAPTNGAAGGFGP
jgi:hypothetical protein